MDLRGRDYTAVLDLTADEIRALIDAALEMKTRARAGDRPPVLAGKVLALVFEKPSLRTNVTFQTGMLQLGGHAVYLGTREIEMGTRESPWDVAKNLDRWVDGIAARTFSHDTILELARGARVPVVNALSDFEHPCQTLATLLTIRERWGRLSDVRIAWIGDGNNVLRSLAFATGKLGLSLTICAPQAYGLDGDSIARARADAAQSHGTIDVTDDLQRAVSTADLILTDVWTSMGQEQEAVARRRAFAPYQVNAALLRHAPAEAVVSHCLPAHRGEEITDEVMDGPRCVAFDEAENRLHSQKALLAAIL